jgi:cytochrome P450
MRSYEHTMVECAQAAFARYRDGERRDFHADAMALTLEIVGKTLLGIEDPAELHRVSHIVEIALDYFQERLYSWGALLPPEFPTLRWLRFRRAKRELDAIVGRVIERAKREDSQADHLLARLIRARDDDGQPMSDQQLLDEAVTMLLAGHETTALGLMYAAYSLATHPDARRALSDEIDTVLGGRPVRADDLAGLPYLDAVVRESLRLYPPAYALGREVIESFELGGYRMPVGAQIAVVPFAQHRSARYWREPERFRPERWLNGETRNLPRYAYMPFGGGHRVCIGNQFASLELALVLATFVQQLTLEVKPGLRLKLHPVITLRVPDGLPVIVRRRKLPALASQVAPGQSAPGAEQCPHSVRSAPERAEAACPHVAHAPAPGEREPEPA